MRVKPKHVLEQHRIAAPGRIENSNVECPLQRHQHQRDGDDRRAQNLDQGRGVCRPHKQRQPEPGQSRGAHAMDGDNEIQSGKDRRESRDKNPQRRRDHVGIGVTGAEGRVERPASIHAAADHRPQRKGPAQDKDVPAQQIDFGKRHVFGAQRQRQHKIPQRSRNGGHQKEEHHHDAVHGEQFVVGVRAHQRAIRRQQVQPDHHREKAAHKEEQRDGKQIQDPNAFVVFGEQPRFDPELLVQVMFGG